MKKLIIFLLALILTVPVYAQRKIVGNQLDNNTVTSVQLADSINLAEIVILTTEDSCFIIGTASDGVRVLIDTTGSIKIDNDLSVADSIRCEEINIKTVEATPFNLGTATDATRASIDSTGTSTFDNDLFVGDSARIEELYILTTDATPFSGGTATDNTRAQVDTSGNATFDGDMSYAGHKDGQVMLFNTFHCDDFTEWIPTINGVNCPASQTAVICWLPLTGLKIGDEVTTYTVVGDAIEAAALTLDAQIYSINKADPLTQTAITNGAMTQVNADGNFDVAVNCDNITVVTDKQYVIQFTATTGVGDSINLMGVELAINRK